VIVALILLAALVTAGGWYIDVRWHPWRPCPSCGGRTRNKGSRPAAYGKHNCRRCGGKGEVRRWGAPGEKVSR
jgi:DnaJ-class molecular chaperone